MYSGDTTGEISCYFLIKCDRLNHNPVASHIDLMALVDMDVEIGHVYPIRS